MSEEPYRVRLKHDLRPLKAGAVGEIVQPIPSRTSILRGTFVRCRFDAIEMDVLSHDLEIIDARWLTETALQKRILAYAIEHHVQSADLVLGHRGGFIRLVVRYNDGRKPDIWRVHSEAKPIIEDLKKRGLLA